VNGIVQESNALRPAAHGPPVVSTIIPCLDEETAIAQVVTSVLAQDVSEVIVVDGGSQDRTIDQATAAGARVVIEPQRGYGRAIQAGIAAARKDAEIWSFSMAMAAIPWNLFVSWCRQSPRGKPSSFLARAFAVHVSLAACRHSRSLPPMSGVCSCVCFRAHVSAISRHFAQSGAMCLIALA
jgi:cellulose synthase/poly-beta-1,6-N-acetylglucosamine synthase-like glycosyltransferase